MDQKLLEWIADYTAGKISAEEARQLREWIEEREENRETFEKYLRLVKAHRMVEGESMICDRKAWDKLSDKLRRSHRKRVIGQISAIAASVLILLGVAAAVVLKQQKLHWYWPMVPKLI